MKIRRALSASAATAVLLPVALAAAPVAQAAPAGAMPPCHEIGGHHNQAFVGRSFGVPQTISLGTKWNNFTATLTNTSKKEMKSFSLSAEVNNYVYNPGERYLSPYADLQYWDPAQKAWKTLRDGDTAKGAVPAPKTLKPRESVHVQLRFRVREGLPLGHQAYDAYAYLTGTFVDRYEGTDCTVSDVAGSTFAILEK
ncbi:hypothetical protein [Streptomyces chrestomyceticus]|uniref:hypothetical protein n=1 Tax=Streptomyces chrestomyceticus TaxID=68185 RepID=UPI0037AB36EC